MLISVSYATVVVFAVLLAIGCLACLLQAFPSDGLRRLKRTTLALLTVLAAVATMEAQKRGSGNEAESCALPQNAAEAGMPAPPPSHGAATDTFRFAGIAVGTETAVLTLAWPGGFFADGTTIDLFSSTSLIESAWTWRSAHAVAADETNWTAVVARTGGHRFFRAAERIDPGDLRDTDRDGIPDAYELRNGTNPHVADYALAPKIVAGGSGADGVTNLAAALAARRLTKADNGKAVAVWIGDADSDGVPDSVEIAEATNPLDGGSYCFNMVATVTGVFS